MDKYKIYNKVLLKKKKIG